MYFQRTNKLAGGSPRTRSLQILAEAQYHRSAGQKIVRKMIELSRPVFGPYKEPISCISRSLEPAQDGRHDAHLSACEKEKRKIEKTKEEHCDDRGWSAEFVRV